MSEHESILAALQRHAASGPLPMHMPGHKRNESLLGGALPWSLDVTEIHGMDELHHPEGLLRDAMARAARAFGASRSWFSVNGATSALLSAMRAMARRGERVLVTQNCHQAVYHALELCGLMPVYVQPPLDARFSVPLSVPPGAVREALQAHPDIAMAVITSPTYDGVLSDVRAIAEILHERGIPLLVDEAHGAHLPFSPLFPEGALECGADVVVHSLHKTLPSLTQTALLHLASNRVDEREIGRQMAIFQTSSPSYPLMASIDSCIALMRERGGALLGAHFERLGRFSERMMALEHLRVLCHGQDAAAGHSGLFRHDPSKLLIGGLDGRALMALLREEHQIELEMAMGDTALALTTLSDTDEAMDRLGGALLEIDARLGGGAPVKPPMQLPAMRQALPIESALQEAGETLPIGACLGRVSKEYVWAYPPGVPLLVPGAQVTREMIAFVERSAGALRSTMGELPGLSVVMGRCGLPTGRRNPPPC